MTDKEFTIFYAKMVLPKIKYAADSGKLNLMQYRLKNAVEIIEKLLTELEK